MVTTIALLDSTQGSLSLASMEKVTNRNIFSGCQLSMMVLMPNKTPLEVRRFDDLYLSSLVEIDCYKQFHIALNWTIYDSFQTELILPEVEREYNDLYIPALTLSYGLYEFKLIATITSSLTTIESKSLFVRIIPSAITVHLIQSSTSLITHGQEEDLKIDPGSYSIDHDGYAFNASVSLRNNPKIFF